MRLVKILGLVAAMLTMANFAFGQTWTQTSAPNGEWISVASSADGSKLVAGSGGIYTSTNSGISWRSNNVSSSVIWTSVASSADGYKLAAVAGNGLICTSTNSGTSWTTNSVPGVYFWWSIASSADGNDLVAVGGARSPSPEPICISTNSGLTWTVTSAPTNYWASAASSADGTKLAAAVFDYTNGKYSGAIYISTNSGAFWTQTSAPTNLPWYSISSSADGTKLAAVSGVEIVNNQFILGSIYTSADSGATWTSNNVAGNAWDSVASSADGSKLIAVAESANVWTSTNFGITWISNIISGQTLFCAASSADGGKLFTGSYSGGIWTLQSTAPPELNLSVANSNLALSWTIPSTNFVLQQSTDLFSWADMTDAPALNLTNLQNQVTLTPSNTAAFYRLKTP